MESLLNNWIKLAEAISLFFLLSSTKLWSFNAISAAFCAKRFVLNGCFYNLSFSILFSEDIP